MQCDTAAGDLFRPTASKSQVCPNAAAPRLTVRSHTSPRSPGARSQRRWPRRYYTNLKEQTPTFVKFFGRADAATRTPAAAVGRRRAGSLAPVRPTGASTAASARAAPDGRAEGRQPPSAPRRRKARYPRKSAASCAGSTEYRREEGDAGEDRRTEAPRPVGGEAAAATPFRAHRSLYLARIKSSREQRQPQRQRPQRTSGTA
jgi:hypothetical protein